MSVPSSSASAGQFPHMCPACWSQLFSWHSDLQGLLAEFVEERNRAQTYARALGQKWESTLEGFRAKSRAEMVIAARMDAEMAAARDDLDAFGGLEAAGAMRSARVRFHKYLNRILRAESGSGANALQSHRLFAEHAWRGAREAIPEGMLHLGNFLLSGCSAWHYTSTTALIPGLPSVASIKRFRSNRGGSRPAISAPLSPASLNNLTNCSGN